MIHDYLKPLHNALCVGLVLVLAYFLGSSLISQVQKTTYHGPQVVVTAPTPNAVGKVAQVGADVTTSAAVNAALHNQDVQLNMMQQTIANAVSTITGASSRMAGAFAYGATQGPPKQQVITVATKADPKASFTVPSPAPNDDAIKRDMKEVLSTTTVNAHVDTSVNVGWEDKGFSPISAVYSSNGASGAAYRLHQAPALELNALGMVNKGKPEAGLDLEHIFKGTSAGVAVGATYSLQNHRVNPVVLVHVHM